MKVKIKEGAVIWQDFATYRWPNSANADSHLNMVFEARPEQPKDGWLDLRAHGYGVHGSIESYGNGSIFVKETDVIDATSTSKEG